MKKFLYGLIIVVLLTISTGQFQANAISNKKMMNKYNTWLRNNRGGTWKICLVDIDQNGIMDATVAEYLFGRIMILTYDKKNKEVVELVYKEWKKRQL